MTKTTVYRDGTRHGGAKVQEPSSRNGALQPEIIRFDTKIIAKKVKDPSKWGATQDQKSTKLNYVIHGGPKAPPKADSGCIQIKFRLFSDLC